MTDLQQRMENKSAKELVEILEFYQEDYTTEALQIAFTILEQRNLSANELTEIRSQIKLEFEEIESKTQKQKELSNSLVKKFLQDKVFYSILIGCSLYLSLNIFYKISFWQMNSNNLYFYGELLLKLAVLIMVSISFYKKKKIGWFLVNGVLLNDLVVWLLNPITTVINHEYSQNGIIIDILYPFLMIEFYLVFILVLGINTNKIRSIFKIKSFYLVFLSLLFGAAVQGIELGVHAFIGLFEY